MALLVQKLWTKKLLKSVSGYFKMKKNPTTTKPGGGDRTGQALVARPIKKGTFLRLS